MGDYPLHSRILDSWSSPMEGTGQCAWCFPGRQEPTLMVVVTVTLDPLSPLAGWCDACGCDRSGSHWTVHGPLHSRAFPPSAATALEGLCRPLHPVHHQRRGCGLMAALSLGLQQPTGSVSRGPMWQSWDSESWVHRGSLLSQFLSPRTSPLWKLQPVSLRLGVEGSGL